MSMGWQSVKADVLCQWAGITDPIMTAAGSVGLHRVDVILLTVGLMSRAIAAGPLLAAKASWAEYSRWILTRHQKHQ